MGKKQNNPQLSSVTIAALIIVIILGGAAALFVFYKDDWRKVKSVKSFEECVREGYPVMESFPRQCRLPNGSVFVEDQGLKKIDGEVAETALSAKVILLKTSDKIITMALDESSKIFDKNLKEADLSAIRRGYLISAEGKYIDDKTFRVQKITIKESPNIIVFAPVKDEEVGLPLKITGEARVFESQLNYRVKDEDGTKLLEGLAMANSQESGLYGPFEVLVNYPEPNGKSGTIEVFDYSAKDGSEIDKVIIPVKFKIEESMAIKVFFGNSKKDPNVEDCKKTYPVTRRIPKTQSVALAALEELLRGPFEKEKEEGHFTSINSGVKIQKLEIKDGTAKVDFDETLQFQVGGSCRVAMINAQIVDTLKQFDTVKKVIVSINGRTEDILQP